MWYSPVPPPDIYQKAADNSVHVRIIKRDGRWFTVRLIDASHGEIITMRSMMPQDYLNSAWQPGQILSLTEDSKAEDAQELILATQNN